MKQLLFMLLLFATSTLYTQNTLKGIVTSTENETIAFANVHLPELEKGTITGQNGNFEIENLPNGNYKLVISLLGFETTSQNISLENKLLTVNIILKPSAIEMEEIIVSTPFHKLQSENVMKVEQKKLSDLKKNGATTISEGITNIAGVESISTGNSIGKPVIRGLSSNRVLVFAQGIRLENQQFGDEHGLGLNASGIESVEVIKGPASLLYGSDALGGVLYFNPERFAKTNTETADASFNYFTNTKGLVSNIGLKSSLGNFKFIIRGTNSEHSDYKTKNYRVTNTRFKEKDLKIALGLNNAKLNTEIRYNLNSSKLGIPEEIDLQSTLKTPLLPFQEINNHLFSSKTKFFFNKSSLKINLGYTYNDRKEFEEHHLDNEEEHDEDLEEVLDPALQMKLKTFSYDAKYQLPTLGKFETIVGTQGIYQTNTNYGKEQLIPDATTTDIGVFATSHIHFKKADLQLGARFDKRNINVSSAFNKNFNSINGAIGIKTELIKSLVTRINIASGFRAPNLAELTSYGSHEGTNRFEIGNSNLKNEQNLQTDLSLEYKSEHFEIFANVFYNHINNFIFISPNGQVINDTPVYEYLQNDATLYGGEFGLHLHPHPLDWLHLESSFETVTGKQKNNQYLPLIPANTLSNIVRAEILKKWLKSGYAFVKIRTTFNQEKINSFETETGSYSLLSVGFGGTITVFNNDLEINVSGNNLTNKRYINHLSRLKADNIFNIGRNFNFGIAYTL